MELMYLLMLLLLFGGNVSLAIVVALLYNNYLWWEKGFSSNEMHLLINVISVSILILYLSLHGWVSRNEEEKLRELDIPEIY
ncbi:MAG: hypothetical protein ACPHUK_06445 [Candidatus Poseidoniaceae archaeon]